MGRTVPTYRMVLESAIGGWGRFRRALRREDREAFDELMRKARLHSSAAGFNTAAEPSEGLFMSILIEHEKEIADLKRGRD